MNTHALHMADQYMKQALDWMKKSDELSKQASTVPVQSQPTFNNIVGRHHQMAIQALRLSIAHAQQFIEGGDRGAQTDETNSW